MKIESKDVVYYMALPYAICLKRDADGDVVARIDELQGCIAHGHTEAEALESLKAVQRAWIETRLESDLEIPEPELEAGLPSGKWIQRVPRTLHQKLARMAKKEKVSLNQLVTSLLAEGLQRREFREFGHDLLAQMRSMLIVHHHTTKRSINEMYKHSPSLIWQCLDSTTDISISRTTQKTLGMGVVPKADEVHYKQHGSQKEISTYHRQ